MNLYIYSYNNYYNRQVKKAGDRIVDYADYLHYGPVQGVYGFTPGDGVNTKQVIGSNAQMYDGKGDYLIAHDPETNEIDSRWFIVDVNRTRNGQWELTLHRDLIVDYYDQIISSPMFIEKATLTNSDAMIWNSEDIQTNKIKTDEWQIMDKTKCAWIVGFLDREYPGDETLSINITNPPIYRVYNVPLEQTDLYQDKSAYYTSEYKIEVYIRIYSLGDYWPYRLTLSSTNPNSWTSQLISLSDYEKSGSTLISQGVKTLSAIVEDLNNLNLTQTLNVAYASYIPYKGNKAEYDSLFALNNLTISCNEQYYNIGYNAQETGTTTFSISSDLTQIDGKSALRSYILNAIGTNLAGDGGIKIVATQPSISLTFTPQLTASFDFKFSPKGTRRILNDAPYDMFCIPYGDKIYLDLGGTIYTCLSKSASLSFAQQLAEKLSTHLLDLQLLPYCPLTELDIDYFVGTDNPLINLDSLVKDKDYSLIQVGNEFVLMLYPTTSSGSLNENQLFLHKWNASTEHDAVVSSSSNSISITNNKKIANQCDRYRLCSPNWNGQFEFNIAKFSEGWRGVRVDYTYLPYSSYIHVNPVFSGLYGEDFDDARGLVCQGDFSILYESDKWETYQVQNKNYANIFNRQIQNMEVNQSVQRNQQIFNAITGTVMGGTAGAVTGAKGGLAGIIAGGVVGTTSSAVGGIMDVQQGDILRNEALDYAKDMFNYNLENIQAMPDSIAKVTAYTKNNKIFPILEYYTCTDIEKNAVANKIAWNGMTVMRIGYMNDFINNKWSYNGIESKGYIKGKLIRFELPVNHKEDLHSEDYHVVNAISGELDKGVYIK